jgi:integrase/recombinase XerD
MGDVGIACDEIEEFLECLDRRGCGSYTLRSYRLGLTDFCRWLAEAGVHLDHVDRRVVEAYVTAFAAGPRGGAQAARPKAGQTTRSPRTVNHRLSVLAAFFGFLIGRDVDRGGGVWAQRINPVPQQEPTGRHGMVGRDAPPRGRRAELRRREPRRMPRDVDPELDERLVEAAASWRDRAILMLLTRTGQRIGDWSDEHGRHGVLGMTLGDFDRRTSSIVVRLKGARDEHRVPVTADFWPVLDRYLAVERGQPLTNAAWMGTRRGRGRPLSYDAFDAALHALTRRLGIPHVTAHAFRHTVAQQVVRHAGVKVAQEILGHRHLSTTADTYAYADQQAMLLALNQVAARQRAKRSGHADGQGAGGDEERFVFHYDRLTLEELDSIAGPRLVTGDDR